ncbi:MAG: Quinolinate synthase [Ignavibacteria bacterium]|nr:MAG: Quinolinate synthase [Ignavibacteria bacterium]KAF0155544.1 MAG: Quinolinate synthase [Ignavibacteria bacterium]
MNKIIEKIKKLKKEKNAVILAHNYQPADIQDIADYVGDSLGLSRHAAKTNASIIVFCGVHFMAETASIISPDKKVLLPNLDAGCSLASSITAEQLLEWKKQHPKAVVVSYVNTSAEIKAESDYCCTSSNAVKVVSSIPIEKDILFLPDRHLGKYVQTVLSRKLNIWDGGCHVHEKIGDTDFGQAEKEHPNAEFLIHPECGCSSSCMLKAEVYFDCKGIHLLSTDGMINYVENSASKEFVIATEVGILHRLKKINPNAIFFALSENAICEYMKLINLQQLYNALLFEQYEVKVPKDVADKARIPINRMIEIV